MKKVRIWAGSCVVEDRKQAIETAKFVRDMGCEVYRSKVWGGGTKPPCFWGLQEKGLEIMQEISRKIMPVAIEIQAKDHLMLALKYKMDNVWIAARAMQNYNLLGCKELGKFKRVVLKRGLGNTIDEWEGAALHLKDRGVGEVVFCERGTAHFDRNPEVRWRPDMLSLVQVKERGYSSMLDSSHSVGRSEYVAPMSLSAVAAGAGYLMIETHKGESMSDKRQALDFLRFKDLVKKIRSIEKVL